MGNTITIPTSSLVTYTKMGRIIELNDGSLILGAFQGNYPTNKIYKSTDNGQTWVLKFTLTGVATLEARASYLAKNGVIYLGFGDYNMATYGKVVRSADGGETWTEVLTVESNALWHIVEDSSANIYVSEYSSGNQDANELYAYNIWKSTDSGLTFAKYYTAPKQSTPGAHDSIRHIHLFVIDSQDRKYISFGEIPPVYAGLAGKNYKMADDLSLTLIADTGNNGWLTFVEKDDGKFLFAADGPGDIYEVDPNTLAYTKILNITQNWNASIDSYFYGMVKGRDGVIYAVTVGSSPVQAIIIASPDNGVTWTRILPLPVSSSDQRLADIFINKKGASNRIHIVRRNDVAFSIPDYSRIQLQNMISKSQVHSRLSL